MDLSQIEGRLQSIENRIQQLEDNFSTAVEPSSDTPPSIHSQSTPSEPPPLPNIFQNAPLQTTNTERTSSGNWLGIIGLICFVLAGAFIIKLAIASGWLTPARQIGIAVIFGFALIGIGFSLLKKDKEYASLLPSAGVIILYLSALSSYRWYFLISSQAALLIILAISLLCIWIYTKIKHDIYPITAALGAYLAPFILNTYAHTDFTLYYFILCSITFAIISVGIQSRTLIIMAAYLALGLNTLTGLSLQIDLTLPLTQFLHFTIFTAATVYYSIRHRLTLNSSQAASFFPVLLFFYATEYYFLNRLSPEWAPWVALLFASLLLGAYYFARQSLSEKALQSKDIVVSFSSLIFFHAIYLQLTPDEFKPAFFILTFVSLLFLPFTTSHGTGVFTRVIRILIVSAILVAEYLRMSFYLLNGHDSSRWLIFSSLSIVALLAFFLLRRKELSEKSELPYFVLGAAHGLAILSFYQFFKGTGSLAVSGAWLIYAVVIMGTAFKMKDAVFARSALIVLGFSAAKVLLYDVANSQPLIRIFCLILTGGVLYGCGFLFRKINRWGN